MLKKFRLRYHTFLIGSDSLTFNESEDLPCGLPMYMHPGFDTIFRH